MANLSRIGGEMYSWSDWDPARGPKIARSGALRYLLAELSGPGLAVLVAGPHDEDTLVSLAETGAVVTCLVRSLGDAERIAAQFPYVTVLCGNVAKLDTTARFDLVIAVDGPDRLVSVEGEQLSVSDMLHILAGLLVPGGILALMYDNLLGIHHGVELDPGGHHGSDSAWYPVSEHDHPRPASLAQVQEHLVGEGLTIENTYAVYPTAQAPSVFIGQDLLGDTASPLRGYLGAALSQAFITAYREKPVLSDPRQLAVRALKAGAESILAPAWLSVVRRGPAARPAPRHGIVVGEKGDASTFEFSVSDGHPRIDVLVPPEDRRERAGMRRVADPTTLALLPGRIFEERLLQLCAYADLPGIRAELSRFVNWLDAQASDGMVGGALAVSTTDNVLDDGYGFHLVPPRWEPVEPIPVNTVIVRALWGFAVRLITGNYPHPWQVTANAQDLTSTLCGTVGRTLNDADLVKAVDLEVAYRAADETLSLPQQQTLRLDLWTIQPGSAAVDVKGYRALVDALYRQRYEVDHLRSTLDWTEQIIRSRDNALSRMDWEIQLYKSTWAGMLIALLRAAYRTLRRDARKVLRSVWSKRSTKKQQVEDATEF